MGSIWLEMMWRSKLGPGCKGPCTLDSCILQVDRRGLTNEQIWTRGKEEGNVEAAIKHFTVDVVLLSHPPGH